MAGEGINEAAGTEGQGQGQAAPSFKLGNLEIRSQQDLETALADQYVPKADFTRAQQKVHAQYQPYVEANVGLDAYVKKQDARIAELEAQGTKRPPEQLDELEQIKVAYEKATTLEQRMAKQDEYLKKLEEQNQEMRQHFDSQLLARDVKSTRAKYKEIDDPDDRDIIVDSIGRQMRQDPNLDVETAAEKAISALKARDAKKLNARLKEHQDKIAKAPPALAGVGRIPQSDEELEKLLADIPEGDDRTLQRMVQLANMEVAKQLA